MPGRRAGPRASASPATVRRDLAALEGPGLSDRTWGDAQWHVALHDHPDYLECAERARDAKRALVWATTSTAGGAAVVEVAPFPPPDDEGPS